MLVEIYCREFNENGVERPKIRFKEGLNVVAGIDEGGKNSIGKSTFLMIIDFVFGGMDYVNKCKDVLEAVGDHTIFFTFEFDGTLYRFARTTSTYKDVYLCDDGYNVIEKKTLDDYNNFLLAHYGMDALSLSFRDAVSCFFRIYHRESLNRNHPLQTAERAHLIDEYNRLLKLMGRYNYIKAAEDALTDAKSRKDAFKNAESHGYLLRARSQEVYKENKAKIANLMDEQSELTTKSEEGHADIDSTVAPQIRAMRDEIAMHNRQIAECENILSAMRRDQSATSKKFAKDFNELSKFFPSADIRKLEEIETFHEKLQVVLSDELKKQEDEYTNTINICKTRIAEIEVDIDKLSEKTNLTKAILDRYAELDSKIKFLERANKMYDEDIRLNKDVNDYKQTLESQKESQKIAIEKSTNAELDRLNDLVCNREKTAPYISLKNNSQVVLEVEKDQGTGAEDRGLILFDIAMLNLTKIPAVAHDSLLLSNIEDNQVKALVKLYAQQKKQIFLAFEKAERYGSETAKTIADHTVLSLHQNGGELFGRSWSQKIM